MTIHIKKKLKKELWEVIISNHPHHMWGILSMRYLDYLDLWARLQPLHRQNMFHCHCHHRCHHYSHHCCPCYRYWRQCYRYCHCYCCSGYHYNDPIFSSDSDELLLSELVQPDINTIKANKGTTTKKDLFIYIPPLLFH